MSGSDVQTSARSTLPVLTLRNLVLFPGVLSPIDIGRASSLQLVEDVLKTTPSQLAIATQRDPHQEEPTPNALFDVGVVAEIVKVVRLAETRLTVVVRGIERCRFGQFVGAAPYLRAEVERVVETSSHGADVEALALSVRETAKQVIALTPEISDEAAQMLDTVREPSRLADLAAANLDWSLEERIALLGENDVAQRLAKVLESLEHRLEVFRVKEKIDTQVREEMSRHQREAVLRQRMKAIRDELGEKDEEDVAEFEEKIQQAAMPAEVEHTARRQLSRLRGMQPASAEYTVTRTYLEWLVELPWSRTTDDRLDLAEARAILDEDHYDLEKVKKRMIEYLAVRKLAPSKKGPILCFVGPPGVGKTSLGRSIARALGREFLRISLGGVRDEAEIRGHRRTYIGALPGRLIQGLKRVGTKNPVFMLDEIDKLGADFRGDPGAALLEVLDPEQNSSFSDHYLEVPFDLSQVIFIATANQLEPIPAALKDRMEVLELAGYTRREKLAIARRYLLPKQLSEHGLLAEHLEMTDGALGEIIDHYTHEAGVRTMEREIAGVVRGVAVKVAAAETFVPRIEAEHVAEYLGPAKFQSEVAERTEVPGVATGLAWTPAGGDILFVEATRMPGKGNLVLTGQLGNVMKESAQAALSYVRARAQGLGIAADFFEKSDLHLHVPAGGVPKDGPSAGSAIFSAIVSLLTGRRVRGDVAMSGEITLRGSVLPVGGIKEKVLAAHRAGVKQVLLPARNEKDLTDVPPEVRAELDIHLVGRLEEVLDLVLEPEHDQPAAQLRPTA